MLEKGNLLSLLQHLDGLGLGVLGHAVIPEDVAIELAVVAIGLGDAEARRNIYMPSS
jgi:hypothetical protein